MNTSEFGNSLLETYPPQGLCLLCFLPTLPWHLATAGTCQPLDIIEEHTGTARVAPRSVSATFQLCGPSWLALPSSDYRMKQRGLLMCPAQFECLEYWKLMQRASLSWHCDLLVGKSILCCEKSVLHPSRKLVSVSH